MGDRFVMKRAMTALFLSFALMFGAAAPARPRHPMPMAAMQSGGQVMPMDGCMHGASSHKGAPCPMLSCFPSVPVFLAPAKSGVPQPDVHGIVAAGIPTDMAVTGSMTETDPPVPRRIPA